MSCQWVGLAHQSKCYKNGHPCDCTDVATHSVCNLPSTALDPVGVVHDNTPSHLTPHSTPSHPTLSTPSHLPHSTPIHLPPHSTPLHLPPHSTPSHLPHPHTPLTTLKYVFVGLELLIMQLSFILAASVQHDIGTHSSEGVQLVFHVTLYQSM